MLHWISSHVVFKMMSHLVVVILSKKMCLSHSFHVHEIFWDLFQFYRIIFLFIYRLLSLVGSIYYTLGLGTCGCRWSSLLKSFRPLSWLTFVTTISKGEFLPIFSHHWTILTRKFTNIWPVSGLCLGQITDSLC